MIMKVQMQIYYNQTHTNNNTPHENWAEYGKEKKQNNKQINYKYY